MRVGEAYALSGEPVHVRGLNVFGAIASQVAIAKVIGKDDYHVRLFRVAAYFYFLGTVSLNGKRCQDTYGKV